MWHDTSHKGHIKGQTSHNSLITAYPSLIEAGNGGNGCLATSLSAKTQSNESAKRKS